MEIKCNANAIQWNHLIKDTFGTSHFVLCIERKSYSRAVSFMGRLSSHWRSKFITNTVKPPIKDTPKEDKPPNTTKDKLKVLVYTYTL